MSNGDHWDEAYDRLGSTGVSWFQRSPVVSERLVDLVGLAPGDPAIDVGGGASAVVDALLARGIEDVSVLDLSSTALARSRTRLGADARRVTWILADVLSWEPDRAFALWHDRALFHFMVTRHDRERYLRAVRAAVRPGGHVVMGTFAADGPTRCSGLAVARYDADDLAAVFGDGFSPVRSEREEHRTPSGSTQAFTWVTVRHDGAVARESTADGTI